MPQLIVKKGIKEIKRIPLGEEVVTIGRGGLGLEDSPDVLLPDTSRRVSRYHAAVILDQKGFYFVRDVGSANGTKVNDKLIYRRSLQDGDRIQIGDFELIYLPQDIDIQKELPLIIVEEDASPTAPPGRRSTLLVNLLQKEKVELPDEMRHTFNDIVKRINSLRDSNVLFAELIELLALSLQAKRGFIALMRSDSTLYIGPTYGINWERGEQPRLSRTILAWLIKKGEVIVESPYSGASVMCGSVRKGGQIIAIVCLERSSRNPFYDNELKFLALICRHVSTLLSKVYPSKDTAKEEKLTEDDFKWKAKMVGNSEAIREIKEKIRAYAPSNLNLLLMGETGTGKEVVARSIHEESPRRKGPFVVVEVSKIGEAIVESELFGHKKGAFTGAVVDKKGAFEVAQGGTLFLDEIGDLTLEVQAKIRRAVEEKEIVRVGSTGATRVDTRIISATNVDLEKAVNRGSFRLDLLQRLGREIKLPPLRERREDIPLLAHYFIDESKRKLKSVSHSAMRFLLKYDWPGNVRELRDLIKWFASQNKEILFSWDLPEKIKGVIQQDTKRGFRSMREVEKEEIKKTLEACGWNYTKAAEILGISRQTLYNKVDEYGIKRPKKG